MCAVFFIRLLPEYTQSVFRLNIERQQFLSRCSRQRACHGVRVLSRPLLEKPSPVFRESIWTPLSRRGVSSHSRFSPRPLGAGWKRPPPPGHFRRGVSAENVGGTREQEGMWRRANLRPRRSNGRDAALSPSLRPPLHVSPSISIKFAALYWHHIKGHHCQNIKIKGHFWNAFFRSHVCVCLSLYYFPSLSINHGGDWRKTGAWCWWIWSEVVASCRQIKVLFIQYIITAFNQMAAGRI